MPEVFDTTLRDGAQMPGIILNHEDRLAIAIKLSNVGIDVLEAGFPSSSEQNFKAVRSISETVEGPVICGFSGIKEEDIETTWEAIEPASQKAGARLNVCMPVSELHLQERFQMTTQESLGLIAAAVRHAKKFTCDVEFSAEDASRADPDFLKTTALYVAEAGATTIMVPDTVGKALPDEYAKLTSIVRDTLDAHGFGHVVVAAHCHNDMGLATANSVAALTKGGAGQVDGTIGGIGERAGNLSLEQLAAISRERPELDIDTNIDTTKLTQLAREVAHRGGVHLQHHLAVVGKNAFRHASGWHQHGMTKNPLTFEHMRPEDYGQQSEFLISDQSGRAGIKTQLDAMAISADSDQLLELRKQVEDFSIQKERFLVEADLEELNAKLIGEPLIDEYYLDLDDVIMSTVRGISTVTVTVNGTEATCISPNGPVDAARMAINKATKLDGNLEDWGGEADSAEVDSSSTVGIFTKVYLGDYAVNVHAHERSADFASILGYIKGLNIIHRIQQRAKNAEKQAEVLA